MDLNLIIFSAAKDEGGGIVQIVAILMIILFAVISSVKGAKKADEKRKNTIPKKRNVADRSYFYTKEEKAQAARQKAYVNEGFEVIEDDDYSENEPAVGLQTQPFHYQADAEDNKFEDSANKEIHFGNLESYHLEPSIKEHEITSEDYHFGKADESTSDHNEMKSSQFSDDERIFSGNISDEYKSESDLHVIGITKGDLKDLSRAVVLAEIFGKPMSMRRPYIEPKEDEFETSHLI